MVVVIPPRAVGEYQHSGMGISLWRNHLAGQRRAGSNYRIGGGIRRGIQDEEQRRADEGFRGKGKIKTNIREGEEGVLIVWVKIVYTNHAQFGKREE